jgi:hypothetical protein
VADVLLYVSRSLPSNRSTRYVIYAYIQAHINACIHATYVHRYIMHKMKQAGVAVTLWICVRQVLGSHLYLDMALLTDFLCYC